MSYNETQMEIEAGFRARAEGHPKMDNATAAWLQGWEQADDEMKGSEPPTQGEPGVGQQALLDEHVYVREPTADPRVTHVAMTEEEENAAKEDAPVNIDVPLLTQTDATLTCTMGNWTGEPTSYTYEWHMDSASIGPASEDNSYVVPPEDVGKTATCLVAATNAKGTTSVLSNTHVVEAGP